MSSSLVINTNIASLNSQKFLSRTGDSLQTSMERLSSGLRVNSANDDAAGLAIANRMTSQIRGMTVAMRNANDGISMAQTAEAGMGNITETLQRMRDLAVQAANRGAVSTSDRQKLQTEFRQLGLEIGRIISNTEFNGKKNPQWLTGQRHLPGRAERRCRQPDRHHRVQSGGGQWLEHCIGNRCFDWFVCDGKQGTVSHHPNRSGHHQSRYLSGNTGCHSEPLYHDDRQSSVGGRVTKRGALTYHGCRFCCGNSQFEPGADFAAGRHRHAGAGQPGQSRRVAVVAIDEIRRPSLVLTRSKETHTGAAWGYTCVERPVWVPTEIVGTRKIRLHCTPQ